MAKALVTMAEVVIDYKPRASRTISATDDTAAPDKYNTQADADCALLKEVCDKIVANCISQTPIQLTIENNLWIVKT